MSEQPDLLGHMLARVIRGDALDAIATARQVLPQLRPASEPALAWRTLLVLGEWRLLRFEVAQQLVIEGRAEAARAGSPGWEALFVALHGGIRSFAGQGTRALGDLVDAEILLTSCDNPGLRRWAQSFIGLGYLQERLYELALPQLLAAESTVEQPVKLEINRLVELHTLIDLHVRWAGELERAADVDPTVHTDDILTHVREALEWVERADEEQARVNDEDLWPRNFSRLRAHAQSFLEPEAAVDELERLRMNQLVRGRRESAIEDAAHLSRALRLLGQSNRACAVAREAVDLVDQHISTSSRMLAHHQLHAAQSELGIVVAHGLSDYVALCTRMLWEQRMRSVETVKARRNLASLQQVHQETTRLTREDPLTGVANRRGLDDWLERNPVGPAAMVMIDIDDFKSINDTYGHGVGDRVLRLVAQRLDTNSRAEDLVVRFGGDEFVILVAGDIGNAHELGRRIRRQILELDLDGLPPGINVSASVGAADVSAEERTTSLVERADRYLMAMKRARLPSQAEASVWAHASAWRGAGTD
jgi:diguanylate cyclase (GGDEF)-like protein